MIKHNILAVDFDGTLVENKWPKIGKPFTKVIKQVKRLKKDGWKLILWSCREGGLLAEAVKYCERVHDLIFDAINDNLPEVIKEYGYNPRKITATFYLDDLALNPLHIGGIVQQ